MFERLYKSRKECAEKIGDYIAELRTQEILIKFMHAAFEELIVVQGHILEPSVLAENSALYAKAAMIELKKLFEDFDNYGTAKRTKENTRA